MNPEISNKNPPPPPPQWIELPGDVTSNILQRLGREGMLKSAHEVCTTWSNACQIPSLWRVVYLCNAEPLWDYESVERYDMMCRRAVDWSQGQMIDLTLEYFGNGELIDYIANRSSNLKRLTLRGCHNIEAIYLTEAVKKLQELEELHLTNMPYVFAADVKNIGLTCPKLKSFSYNGRGSKHPCTVVEREHIRVESHEYEYALAIGTSMPNLRHLRLFALPLQDESLEAILDACPHLESLDLRQCYSLNLEGDLGERCRKQIKDLRLPFDSASDIQQLVGGPSEW